MTALATCPPGFTVPFTGTMTPQDLTPVRWDAGPEEVIYGWLVAGPLERLDSILMTIAMVMDYEDGWQWHPDRGQVHETSGCACGNPWILCHPYA